MGKRLDKTAQTFLGMPTPGAALPPVRQVKTHDDKPKGRPCTSGDGKRMVTVGVRIPETKRDEAIANKVPSEQTLSGWLRDVIITEIDK
jgi:hypothetical protein